jgi:hypothetical protein
MSKAPVCPISRNQALSGMPMRRMPAIPRANDLASAIAALNEIANLIQNPGVNSGTSDGFSQGESVSGGDNNNNPKVDDGSGGGKKKKRWDETERNVVQVEVFNPDDHDISIKFPQITRLAYEEIRTMTTWDWNL